VQATSLSIFLNTTVAVGVVTGTPGSSPTVPALPGDTSTTFYIPLAAIRVPTGFNSLSTVSPRDIRDQAPVIPLSRHLGGVNIAPANGNNDGGGGGYATNFGWPTTGGQRPSVWLPPSMVGGEQRIIEVDCTNATAADWSHPPQSVVDSSVDWRGRFFLVFWQVAAGSKFANDQTASSSAIPITTGATATSAVRLANSLQPDGQALAGNPSVFFIGNADSNQIASSATLGLYVDTAGNSGKLMFNATTSPSPGCRLFCWIQASAPFLNY